MKTNRRLDHKPFLVPPGKRFRLKDHPPGYTGQFKNKGAAKEALIEDVTALAEAQQLLWASAEYSVIIIFQALDAAGKDGTIRHVMSGVNPQGVEVHSFKAPTEEERLRHFLWRPMKAMPARGRIAIFNRSYYEEVLVVRVHPELLEYQYVRPELRRKGYDRLWEERYESINRLERTLTQNGCCVIKFFLHVSRAEQKERFLERINNPEKHWKFSAADIRERAFWDDYQRAYEQMLQATSTSWAPWYVVPADHKWFTRAVVADIIASRIGRLKLRYPKPTPEQIEGLEAARQQLEAEK
ncbi:MAG: polyphosphate kinase 2 family protein [Verrucomicrobiales bacterium]|nr:polyphosphate kinase 2 family protein [Verrucomicrobiales bacterium]